MSVSNPDVMPWPVTSSCNPEVTICPCPIVIVMVMSSGNLDVTSHPLHQSSSWIFHHRGCYQIQL